MSDDEILDVEDEGDKPPDDHVVFDKVRAQLESRCKAAGIKVEEDKAFEGLNFISVHLPAGRDTQPIVLTNADRISQFLNIEFEKYVCLKTYLAICSYSDRVIEAAVRSQGAPSLPLLFPQLLQERIDTRIGAQGTSHLELSNPVGTEKIVVGPGTQALQCLTGGSSLGRARYSIRIEGVEVSRHDHAVEILERLANSLFFQIDLLRGMSLALVRRRALRFPTSRRAPGPPKPLEFPKNEYDRDPISLYWYARGATGMPLLQFLAYYQTIEYYFPSYSQAEARRKIRNILKNPAFRADRDTDLGRILLAAGASGSGFGDERSQLRATLNESLEPGALHEFLTDSEEKVKFFSTKTEGLTDKKLQIRDANVDLRNDVADRIYDIRCKIVHTKSGGREGDVELLLPFSKEADLLYADIHLIQFVAREVLVSASSPLRLRDSFVDE